MRSRPIALLALAFSVFTTVAQADTLLTWEFPGTFTPTGPYGTQPFKLQVSFDPTAPDIRDINLHLGLHLAITSATLQIGDDSMTTSGMFPNDGYIAVNCWWRPGCDRLVAGSVEFVMYQNWLRGTLPFSISYVDISFYDPTLDGHIPTTPPTTAGITIQNYVDGLVWGQGLASVRSVDDPVVPEPASFLLLGTGLAGLYAGRRGVPVKRKTCAGKH